MTHDVKAIFDRELAQLDWSNGRSKPALVEHFRMAPTIREMLEKQLPETTFKSAAAVSQSIPQSAWRQVEQTIRAGTPESHFLQSRAAQPNDLR